MNDQPPKTDHSPDDPRVRFAAERTLLAWMRTGLALMGSITDPPSVREHPADVGRAAGLAEAQAERRIVGNRFGLDRQ